MRFALLLTHPGALTGAARVRNGDPMAPESAENRLESLDRRVTKLEELPERIDRLELQIVQLRGEMRAEFSAVRKEIRDGDVMVVTALTEAFTEALTEQVEEARRHTSVLFEDAVGRIAVVSEGLAANVAGLKALDDKVDRFHTSLTTAIDVSRAETRAMFEQVFSRLDVATPSRRPSRLKKR